MLSVTPRSTGAGAASLLTLPPSPEGSSPVTPATVPGHLSLDDSSASKQSKFRSIAWYGPFQPQAIACSAPFPSLFSNDNDVENSAGGSLKKASDGSYGCSLTAIAGPNGVALFHISRPQSPLVVLSHASATNNQAAAVTSLSFQPHTSDSLLLLAAARGCGVLVWDASGHRLSPLMGRLGLDITDSLTSDLRITSIAWKDATPRPLLATTNATTSCIWDLRTSLGTNLSRPSLRFGVTRDTTGSPAAPLVQISCSDTEQCATLDLAGTVRVYDIRMTDRSKDGAGELSRFSSSYHVGVGLAFLPTKNADTCWLTWGLDTPQSDAIVRVWSNAVVNDKDPDPDSYWFMDGESTPQDRVKSMEKHYRRVAQFSMPHLACARVCPEPFESNIVTVGLLPSTNDKDMSGWQADVWKLDAAEEDTNEDVSTFGVKKIASSRGGTKSDTQLSAMIGSNATLGSLRGAELALQLSPAAQRFHNETNEEARTGVEHNPEVLLCCLSENGYVTTHAVIEATSRPTDPRETKDLSIPLSSPTRRGSNSFRPFLSHSSRVYPDDGEGVSEKDAASLMRNWGDIGGQQLGIFTSDGSLHDSIPERGLRSSPPHRTEFSSMRDDDPSVMPFMTQFDIDIPMAYGSAPVTTAESDAHGTRDLSPSLIGSMTVVTVNTDEMIEAGIQQGNATMERINKERVPCPRLCGASFSPGIGGVVCFRNGEVLKMWSWYQQSDARRHIQVQEIRKGPTYSQPQTTSDASTQETTGGVSPFLFGSSETTLEDVDRNEQRECPRTLQDLESMTTAAMKAQWREDIESDESSGDESGTSVDTFEDSNSLMSDDLNGEEVTPMKREIGRREMYESYFGHSEIKSTNFPNNRTKDTSGESSITPSKISSVRGSDKVFTSLSSDLAPVVLLTHKYDDFVFNGQCAELAQNWVLGDWDTVEDEDLNVSSTNAAGDAVVMDSTRKGSGGLGWMSPDSHSPFRHGEKSSSLARESSPQFSGNTLIESPSRMAQARSDPMLDHMTPKSPARKVFGVFTDDAPVHGGKYSVPVNKQEELMVLLGKVNAQQDGRFYQNMRSPPDRPMLPMKIAQAQVPRSISSNAILQTASPLLLPVGIGASEHPNRHETSLGVYVLSTQSSHKRKDHDWIKQQETLTTNICVHNANVCSTLGQSEKANVWLLLAQVADNVLHDEYDDFNGWGGASGGALGADLISSLLRYYEAQGDVQMLSTMVCVLSRGQRRLKGERRSLLPAHMDDRYDAYIRRYADILYSWGIFTIRAELNKHVVQRLPGTEGQQLLPVTGDAKVPGIYLNLLCPHCSESVGGTGIVCPKCHDFAFRCSICENAVRGLFTVCSACGHGGHVNHIMCWFANHSTCPSGCGCSCVLTTFPLTSQSRLDGPVNTPAVFGKSIGLDPMKEMPELVDVGSRSRSL